MSRQGRRCAAPKLPWVLLLVLAVLGSFPLVSASLTEFDSDMSTDIAARATTIHNGTAVGTSCTVDVDCYSRNCYQGKCSRQFPTGPCFEDGNCNSRNCDLSIGQCSRSSKLYGVCANGSSDCSTTASGGQLLCDRGICRLRDGAAGCSADKACLSRVCGSDKKCASSGPGYLTATQRCNTSAQCIGKQCNNEVTPRDDIGVNEFIQYAVAYQCQYLATGQGPCKVTADCYSDVCKDGVCKGALDGENCDMNYRCAGNSVCSITNNGTCYTPTRKQSAGAACKTGDQCISNRCYQTYTYRYSLALPRRRYPEFDTFCAQSPLGGPCAATPDCEDGRTCDTNTKTCIALPLGATCSNGNQCDSSTCIQSKCARSSAYAGCDQNSDCFSNVCGTNADCYYYCPPTHCAAVPDGGACRVDGDCRLASRCQNKKCVFYRDPF